MQYPKEYVVFDFETTGLDTLTCDVIEIGALKNTLRDGQVLKTWLINIGKPLPEKITEITGITDDMLLEGTGEKDAFLQFIDFCGRLPLIGHNIVGYDIPILERKVHDLNLQNAFNWMHAIDTAVLFKAKMHNMEQQWHENHYKFGVRVLSTVLPGKFNLGHAFEVCDGRLDEGMVAHRAGADVIMANHVYKTLTNV